MNFFNVNLKIDKNIFSYLILFTLFYSLISKAQSLSDQQSIQHSQDIESFLRLSPVDAYLELEQNYNIAARLRNPVIARENSMKPEEKDIFEIDLYDVGSQRVDILDTRFPSVVNQAFDTDGGILVPVLRNNGPSTLRFQQPVKTVKARKLLGRSSYLILPGQGLPLTTVKVFKYFPGVEQKGYRAILNNDFIATYQDLLPEENQNGFLAETRTAQVKSIMGLPYTFVLRDMTPIEMVEGNERVLPAHGLLGCEFCLEALAQKKGLSVIQWKKKIWTPLLARTLAQYNLILGISPEAHTQNLVIKVNFDTGDILKIYSRDRSDDLLDPLPLISSKKFQVDPRWELLNEASFHRGEFIDWTVPEAKDIWYQLAIYAGQSVDGHARGFKARKNLNRIFLQNYWEEAQRILNRSIPLSADAENVMNSLEVASDISNLYTGELNERGRFRNALASVLKSIYESCEDIFLNQLNQNPATLPTDAELEVQKVILQSLRAGQVRYFSEEARKTLQPFYARFMETVDPSINMLRPSLDRATKALKDIKISQLKFSIKAIEGFINFYVTYFGDAKPLWIEKMRQLQAAKQNTLASILEKMEVEDKNGFKKDRLKGALRSFVIKRISRLTIGLDLEQFSIEPVEGGFLIKEKSSGKDLAISLSVTPKSCIQSIVHKVVSTVKRVGP